jgi:hypothetical protein
MEISESIPPSFFSIKMCAHKKKLSRRRPTRLKHMTSDGGGVNGKTVPSNSADSWVRSKGYKLCEKCAEKSEINVSMIIIVLDSAVKRVVCVDALIMYRSKKKIDDEKTKTIH